MSRLGWSLVVATAITIVVRRERWTWVDIIIFLVVLAACMVTMEKKKED